VILGRALFASSLVLSGVFLVAPASAQVVSETAPDSRALVGGTVFFGVGYGAALALGERDRFQNESAWLAAPVVGPWGALAARGGSWELVGDGVLQSGGALIAVGSFLYPRRVLGPAQGRRVRHEKLALEYVALRPGWLGVGARFR